MHVYWCTGTAPSTRYCFEHAHKHPDAVGCTDAPATTYNDVRVRGNRRMVPRAGKDAIKSARDNCGQTKKGPKPADIAQKTGVIEPRVKEILDGRTTRFWAAGSSGAKTV